MNSAYSNFKVYHLPYVGFLLYAASMWGTETGGTDECSREQELSGQDGDRHRPGRGSEHRQEIARALASAGARGACSDGGGSLSTWGLSLQAVSAL